MKKAGIIIYLTVVTITSLQAQTWKPLGTGISCAQSGACSVFAMTVDSANNYLYVGGTYDSAGGKLCRNLARWDGQNWSAVATLGFGGAPLQALAMFQNILWVGGKWNSLGTWNGTTVQTGANSNGNTYCMTVWNGKLIVGGEFTKIAGVTVNGLAQYDGTSWSSVGGGVSGCPGCSVVNALTVWNGNLVIGGIFTQAGSTPANNVAVWDGTNFTALGSGTAGGGTFGGGVYALTVYKGDVIAGGEFTSAGGVSAKYIAGWNGVQWYSLASGLSDGVTDLQVFHNELYVCGYFYFGTGFNSAVKWDGISFSALDTRNVMGNFSSAMEVYNDDLIIGGGFGQYLGKDTIRKIVAYDYIPASTQNSLCTQPDCNGTASADTAYRVSPIKYKWSTGDSTQTVTNLCAGSYTVTVTDSTGEEVQGTAIITAPSALNIKDTITNATCATCADGSAGVTVSGGMPPYTYDWDNSETASAITNQLPDTFYVTVTDSNGCVARDTVVISFNTKVEELRNADFGLRITPNPVNELLVVSCPLPVQEVNVIDLMGNIHKTQDAGHKTELDVSHLPPGIYFLNVRTKQGSSVTKFVKQ